MFDKYTKLMPWLTIAAIVVITIFKKLTEEYIPINEIKPIKN